MSFKNSPKPEHSPPNHDALNAKTVTSIKSSLLFRGSSNIPKISNKVTPLQKAEIYSVRDTVPTRLPAPPRRPIVAEHKEERITPPSSPVEKKNLPRLYTERPSGQPSQELGHADPLISPIESDINRKETPFIDSSVKAGTMASSCPMEKTLNSTRLPIPIQKITPFKPGKGKCKHSIESNSSSESEYETKTPGEMVTLCKPKEDSVTTRLRKPEIFKSKLLKNACSSSFIPPTDIVQENIVKERENSTNLSASLISAHGVISQPDEEEPNESIMNKLHDKLQLFVGQEQDEPSNACFKRKSIEAMNTKTALQRFKPFLSSFEKTEILKYHSVYCAGTQAKKHMAKTDQPSQNYGYDDENGDYQIIVKDHLNYRYEIIESLGKGSFGQVVKCKDMKPPSKKNPSDQIVAVKIIRNKKRFHAQALTEIKILEKLMQLDPHNKHSIVRMLGHFYFRDHLCIVFECLSSNLFEVLQQNSYQGFSMGLVKRFASQILAALTLLSDNNIIHCDLKPENILLKRPDKSGIRVIDLGSSCFVNERVYSYIQSRFYRAPEVILGLEYGLPIDIWSTGCILAELYTGRPLFPGESEPDQLACIMQLIGVPKKNYLDRCTRKKQFFDMYDSPKKSINSKGKKRKPNSLTFTEALKRSSHDNFDRDFVDFISRCLTWEPSERMTLEQALDHPWLKPTKR